MSLPVSTSDIFQEVSIRLTRNDEIVVIPPRTVMQVFDETAQKYASKPAFHQKVLKPGIPASETEWTTWTWEEYRGLVGSFGKALLSLGFERFDGINILGFNAPEWFIANFGAIAAGGVSTGIYATNQPEACKYISEDSKARVLVVDGLVQLEKYYKISKKLPNLKAIVMYGPDEFPLDIKNKCSVQCYKFAEFLKLGKSITDQELKKVYDTWKPGEVVELIYTSGTTGPPKAAMITNDNIVWVADTMMKGLVKGMTPDDVLISYLPLSHIAAQGLDMFGPLLAGYQIYFAQSDALKGSLGDTLKEVRPTLFFGVPRVFEKIYDKMQEAAKATTGLLKIIATWAKGHSATYWASKEFESTTVPPFYSYLFYIIAKFFLGKIHQKLGLDRCQVLLTGAAPTEKKIFDYFASIDIPIFELFGQTECTGPHTLSSQNRFKTGSVGPLISNVESKIDEGTSELLIRGRHVFAGYKGQPELTAQAIDEEGWLHTGDTASIDRGFVFITGRLKEIIITAGGENIPPVLIETEMKKAMPALGHCMVIGDNRKFLTVLLCLIVEVDANDGNASNTLDGVALETSKKIGSVATTTDEALACPKWRAYFDEGLSKANEYAMSRAQKVAKWALHPSTFTEKGGELTPTLKLKRHEAIKLHSTTIDKLYS